MTIERAEYLFSEAMELIKVARGHWRNALRLLALTRLIRLNKLRKAVRR